MRMRRRHAVEVARYFQRLENIERRRIEAEKANKKKRSIWQKLTFRG